MSALSKDFTSKQFFRKMSSFVQFFLEEPTFICMGKFHFTNRVLVEIKGLVNIHTVFSESRRNNQNPGNSWK